jgi:hypothetical protein
MVLFDEHLLLSGKWDQGDPFTAAALQLDSVFFYLGNKASTEASQIFYRRFLFILRHTQISLYTRQTPSFSKTIFSIAIRG